MFLTTILVTVGLVPAFATASASDSRQALAPAIHCAVTQHSGIYGSDELSTFGLWPGGEIVFKPDGPGFVTTDGALGMKFGWQRGIRGKLTITGRRLDAAAPPLRSEVNDGYGDIGFQASYVIFPTPGCWEVTGHVAGASVTFVTSVVKIGNGPGWRRP
jgi:hypothetical protein